MAFMPLKSATRGTQDGADWRKWRTSDPISTSQTWDQSAPMTTDDGVDLVVYAPLSERALTVQVKTNLRPKPAGGKGKLALDWWLPLDSPAQLVGIVNLERDQAWLFTRQEFFAQAQQRPQGRAHFYFYVDPDYAPADGSHERKFEPFSIKHQVPELFGITPSSPLGRQS